MFVTCSECDSLRKGFLKKGVLPRLCIKDRVRQRAPPVLCSVDYLCLFFNSLLTFTCLFIFTIRVDTYTIPFQLLSIVFCHFLHQLFIIIIIIFDDGRVIALFSVILTIAVDVKFIVFVTLYYITLASQLLFPHYDHYYHYDHDKCS